MNEDALQAQIDDLQSKVAFQEHTIESLNLALTEQQAQLTELKEKFKLVVDKLKSLQHSNIASADEETPPPHY
ncbi:SlyX family protein [Alteromonas facilis]|uniref:SlyX family protein n=1 Tax=Alteromonas facilis TaxID=2048004 RepID=UPI000C288A88|nr:SlyX family protein [Alteromonas facilis]